MTSPDGARPVPASDLVPALARGIDEAGYAIFRAAASDHENTVISPASIGLAFGMAGAGASGRLATAIAEAFDLPGSGEETLAAFHAYEQRLSIAPGATVQDPVTGDPTRLPTVTVANRIFTDAAVEPRAGFHETVERWFGASTEAVPLRTDPAAAARRVNAWIDDRTHGLIRDLLSEPSFSEDSLLMLVNALCMKAAWRDALDPEATERLPFTRMDGVRADVPLMDATPTASGVAERDGYVAASLAYAGGTLEMVVIVPEAGRFAQVRAAMGGALLEEIDASWLDIPSSVQVPRFVAGSTVQLRDVMESALGVGGLFGTAGLDGIAPDLEIAGAVHATTVIVNEEGTEAAAVTAIDMVLTGAPLRFLEVRADRPFLYVIRDLDTGAVLFVGQVLDPVG